MKNLILVAVAVLALNPVFAEDTAKKSDSHDAPAATSSTDKPTTDASTGDKTDTKHPTEKKDAINYSDLQKKFDACKNDRSTSATEVK